MPPRELTYELHLSEPTSSNNAIKGMHFHAYKKLRNGWRASVLAAIGGKVPAAPIARSALEIERNCAGSLGWDNAYGGLKPLLDCLVAPSARNPEGLGLIQDDSPKFIPEAPRMTQVAAKRGADCTIVASTPSTNWPLAMAMAMAMVMVMVMVMVMPLAIYAQDSVRRNFPRRSSSLTSSSNPASARVSCSQLPGVVR